MTKWMLLIPTLILLVWIHSLILLVEKGGP